VRQKTHHNQAPDCQRVKKTNRNQIPEWKCVKETNRNQTPEWKCVKETHRNEGRQLMGALLGRGGEGISGDMGFEPDTPSPPRPGHPTPIDFTQQKGPAEMPHVNGWSSADAESSGVSARRRTAASIEELLRQCVHIDCVMRRGFVGAERRDFADQPIAQKLLQCQ